MHHLSRRTKIALAAGSLLPLVTGGASLAATHALGRAGASTVAGTCSSDWPSYQHDGSHTGAACSAITTSNVATLAPGWFVPTNNAVTAEPAIAGGTAYVGDGGGTFYALDVASGAVKWTYNITGVDSHSVSYGEITSSAAYTDSVPGRPAMVLFGGGGTVFALNAATGAPVWSTDLAPSDPTGPDEVESSPAIVPGAGPNGDGLVVVGLDTNESTSGVSGGLVALDAVTGAPVWSYEPSAGAPAAGLPSGSGNGCNDVWSSPAVDAATGRIIFSTGNCPDGHGDIEALSLTDGQLIWDFTEPAANHGGDDDFGSPPILASLGGKPVVVEGGKSGWIYVLDEATGGIVNSHEVAEPGQTGDALAGAIGGFIGGMALAPVGADQVAFGNSAIPAPFSGDGVDPSNPTATTPDASLAQDPTRAGSLHAYDITTGNVLWQEPLQTASYAPVTETGGVVFAPSTTGFSLNAYNAANGLPLWSFPLASSPSGGVAVSGADIVFGTGTYQAPNAPVPPQATGIWMMHLAGS